MRRIQRYFGLRYILPIAGAALSTMVANSLQVKEYIYLGNRIIAIDASTGAAVTSASVGTPVGSDKCRRLTLRQNSFNSSTLRRRRTSIRSDVSATPCLRASRRSQDQIFVTNICMQFHRRCRRTAHRV